MTLRSRLLVSLVVLFTTLVVASVAVAHSQRGFLVEQVDRQLDAAAGPAMGFVRPEPRGRTPRGCGDPSSPGPTALSELFVASVGADGELTTVLAPCLTTSTAPVFSAAQILRLTPSDPSNRTSRNATLDASDGTRFRAGLMRGFDGNSVLVALPLDRADAAYRRLLLGGLAAGLSVVLIGALVVWWVVRLGLRPIRRMTEAADAIACGELTRRVDAGTPSRTEAAHLARAFNLMLDERQAAEQRLRQFVGDASHELRTPLTSIRGYVDLYRKGGLRGEGELDDAMRRVAQESARMGDLVDDLLLLARLDQGRPLATEPVNLSNLLHDAVSDAFAQRPDNPVGAEIAPGLTVIGDEARLRQVVAVLVANALVHTPADAIVVVRGHEVDGVRVIDVVDSGPGMAPDIAERAFERFVRGDSARTRHRGGSGLGLAIVRSIVEAHGGRVALESQPGTGTVVRVVLPAPLSDHQRIEAGPVVGGTSPPVT